MYPAEVVETLESRKSCAVIVLEVKAESLVLLLFWKCCLLFEDIHYSHDHHRDWSFRRHIGIPRDLMPDLWMNRKSS
jgi:hypothetical protein